MTWEADDIKHLRRHIARADELAEKMRAAEAAGDETNAVGAGLAFESEMDWLAPECVSFAKAVLDAFDVMERDGWYLTRVMHSDETQDYWVVKITAAEVACGPSPLAALLAATEGKSDG